MIGTDVGEKGYAVWIYKDLLGIQINENMKRYLHYILHYNSNSI